MSLFNAVLIYDCVVFKNVYSRMEMAKLYVTIFLFSMLRLAEGKNFS